MISEVCVDANLAVKWYLFEEEREQATALLDDCDKAGIAIIAPDIILGEVGSSIRRAVYRELITEERGRSCLMMLKRAPIRRFDVRDLFD